mgnify:CR=1 FL=1
MSYHIELKCQIISHRILKILFCWYLIIKVIERMKPLIFRLDSCFYTELGFNFNSSKPYIKQMLPFVFGTCCFFQTNVFAHYKSIVLKIDEFRGLL